MADTIRGYIDELQRTLDAIPVDRVKEVADVLHTARMAGRKVLIMGNGGSAATASHFVCDLGKNTRQSGLPPFCALGLTDSMPVFSAYANDEGYESVFAGQLANLVEPRDVVIAISASGNSPNVIRATELAKESQAITIGLTGFDGGRLGALVDYHVHVPCDSIQHVEDVHLALEHMISSELRELAIAEGLAPPAAHLRTEMAEGGGQEENPAGVLKQLAGARRKRASLDLLYDISRELAGRSDPHSLLERILGLIVRGIEAGSGSIMVFDENGKVTEGAVSYGGRVYFVPVEQLAELVDRGLAGWVAQNRQAALVPNTRDDPRWLRRTWENIDGFSRSAVSVPLMVQDRVIGVLTIVRPQAGQFSGNDLVLLIAVAASVSLNGVRFSEGGSGAAVARMAYAYTESSDG